VRKVQDANGPWKPQPSRQPILAVNVVGEIMHVHLHCQNAAHRHQEQDLV